MRSSALALVLLSLTLELGCGCDGPSGSKPGPDVAQLDSSCSALISNAKTCTEPVNGEANLLNCTVDPAQFAACAAICDDNHCHTDALTVNLQGHYEAVSDQPSELPKEVFISSTGTDNSSLVIAGASPLVNDTPVRKVYLPAKAYGALKSAGLFSIYRYTKKTPCDYEIMAISGSVPVAGDLGVSCAPLDGVNVRYIRFTQCNGDRSPTFMPTVSQSYTWNRVVDDNFPLSCKLVMP